MKDLLDLLLHLIEKAEVDIYDIPIAEITYQYLEYLELIQEMDMEAASEFIVMAATLVEIKSKMLLPKLKKRTTLVLRLTQEKSLFKNLLSIRSIRSLLYY